MECPNCGCFETHGLCPNNCHIHDNVITELEEKAFELYKESYHAQNVAIFSPVQQKLTWSMVPQHLKEVYLARASEDLTEIEKKAWKLYVDSKAYTWKQVPLHKQEELCFIAKYGTDDDS